MNTTNQQSTTSLIQLEKVAADYKLTPGESFLTQGRINKQHPTRPYYHTVMRATAAAMPAAPATQQPAHQPAIAKLWNAATLELLKEKAAALAAGAKTSISLSTADILAFIADIGNRERATISGEELEAFAASYAFGALAQVYGWNQQQIARVTQSLKQYAAPAHRKPQADASILLQRLEALPSLLTGDDSALDADLQRVYSWLETKLQRDAATADTNLADSI